MAFTLSQFKSALGNNGGAAVEATTQFANKAWDTTKSTAATVGSTVKGVMPATNKKVDGIAAKFNTRLNNVEMQQRVDAVKISMIAQATGVNLPTDEEIVEAILEDDRLEAQAKKDEEVAKKVAAVADVVVNPEVTQMLGMLAQKLFGTNPFGEVEEDEEEEIIEIKQPEPKKEENVVKMETKKDEGVAAPLKGGRRKLGRQAPLAD
jgi:hypothetical protein